MYMINEIPTFLIILIGLVANNFIGSLAMMLMDDKEQSLYEWVKKAPFGLGAVVVQLWPVVFFYWLKTRRDPNGVC